MKSRKVMPEKMVKSILKDIFQLIPGLILEIAPTGYGNSPYNDLIHDSARVQYEQCKRQWELNCLFCKYREVPAESWPVLEDFECFNARLQPTVPDPIPEMRILLCFALLHLGEWGYFRQQATKQILHLGPTSELSTTQLNKLLLITGSASLGENARSMYLRIYKGFAQADTLILFQYLFRILKAHDLQWHYYDSTLEVFIDVVRSYLDKIDDVALDQYNPVKAVRDCLGLDQPGRHHKNRYGLRGAIRRRIKTFDIERILHQAQEEMPPDMIIAYFDIYGHWPEGYPPQREEYE